MSEHNELDIFNAAVDNQQTAEQQAAVEQTSAQKNSNDWQEHKEVSRHLEIVEQEKNMVSNLHNTQETKSQMDARIGQLDGGVSALPQAARDAYEKTSHSLAGQQINFPKDETDMTMPEGVSAHTPKHEEELTDAGALENHLNELRQRKVELETNPHVQEKLAEEAKAVAEAEVKKIEQLVEKEEAFLNRLKQELRFQWIGTQSSSESYTVDTDSSGVFDTVATSFIKNILDQSAQEKYKQRYDDLEHPEQKEKVINIAGAVLTKSHQHSLERRSTNGRTDQKHYNTPQGEFEESAYDSYKFIEGFFSYDQSFYRQSVAQIPIEVVTKNITTYNLIRLAAEVDREEKDGCQNARALYRTRGDTHFGAEVDDQKSVASIEERHQLEEIDGILVPANLTLEQKTTYVESFIANREHFRGIKEQKRQKLENNRLLYIDAQKQAIRYLEIGGIVDSLREESAKLGSRAAELTRYVEQAENKLGQIPEKKFGVLGNRDYKEQQGVVDAFRSELEVVNAKVSELQQKDAELTAEWQDLHRINGNSFIGKSPDEISNRKQKLAELEAIRYN